MYPELQYLFFFVGKNIVNLSAERRTVIVPIKIGSNGRKRELVEVSRRLG